MPTTTAPMGNEHLTAEVISAYVDGALSTGELVAADEHLASCAECRRELAAVADLIAAAPRARRRRTWPIVATGLAAAALAFVLVPRAPVPSARKAIERGARPNANSIDVLVPAENDFAGPGGRATIIWRRVEPGVTYHMAVMDTTGATRWKTETTDTSVVLPDSVGLEPNSRYYLTIDALRSDGWSTGSGPRAFRTPR